MLRYRLEAAALDLTVSLVPLLVVWLVLIGPLGRARIRAGLVARWRRATYAETREWLAGGAIDELRRYGARNRARLLAAEFAVPAAKET